MEAGLHCYLLKDKLGIRLEAAHFNHCLRGEESDRDEVFVRELCNRYDIPLHVGSGEVKAGKKGLEAAARDARYVFLRFPHGAGYGIERSRCHRPGQREGYPPDVGGIPTGCGSLSGRVGAFPHRGQL